MLQLRPTCEHCNKPLAPDSSEAMICSYECTFCCRCVAILDNICPNCGGGFNPRPVRPSQAYVDNNSLLKHPASTRKIHKPVDLDKHQHLSTLLKTVAPEKR